MEYCGCLLDEREISRGLCGGGGHVLIIPLSSLNQRKVVIADRTGALHALQLSKVEHVVMKDAEFYQRAGLAGNFGYRSRTAVLKFRVCSQADLSYTHFVPKRHRQVGS